jgi:ubiquinone/menaquinone biosynthesis C-methylase UbiE
MQDRPKGYIPAAGYDRLLPLYDPIVRLLFPEQAVKRRLVEEAQIGAGDRVLDVGCGTGTLAVLAGTVQREAKVVGLDGDAKALASARRKAAKAAVEISFEEGLSYELPYSDESFDRVLSSLVFHHLTREHKRRTLAEILRVLTPGGTFHLLDFGKPVTFWDRCLARVLFRGEEPRDNVEGHLPSLIQEAGFSKVEEAWHRRTIIARLWCWRASKLKVV